MYTYIYIDDIIISENDTEYISKQKSKLNESFKTNDLGNLSYFFRN